MILLDTSILIDFFKGKNKTFDISNSEVVTTVITYHEILSGLKHKKAKNEEKFFRRFFTEVEILEYDIESADKSSEIMSKLLSIGKVVNTFDVLIAGIALANGIDKIASRDNDFNEISRVTGLEIIN